MNLKQLVKKELKRGDVQRIAEIMDVTHSGATSVLNNENFDSLRYLLAICKVTGKPIEYFLTVYDQYIGLLSEPLEPYGLNTSEELLAAYKAEKNEKTDLYKELGKVKSELIDALQLINRLKGYTEQQEPGESEADND